MNIPRLYMTYLYSFLTSTTVSSTPAAAPCLVTVNQLTSFENKSNQHLLVKAYCAQDLNTLDFHSSS